MKIYSKKSDVLILISSSGNSKNMINAANFAKNKLTPITFTGFKKDNKLNGRGKINFWVDSLNYNHIENIHQIILLTICDYISKKKF